MPPRQPGRGFIFITLLLDILGIGLVVPLMPRMVEQFTGGGPANAALLYGFFAALYAVMQFLFSPLLGNLSDRFGRRPVLLLSLVGTGLAYLAMGWAPTLTWLFVARAMGGITGASIGTATAYLADVSPPEKRAQSFALVGVAFGLGFILGPAMGGILGQYDLKLPFYVASALAFANALYGLLILPESLPTLHRRPFSLSRANPLGTLRTLAPHPLVLALCVPLVLSLIAQRGIENVWALYTEYRFAWGPRQIGLSLALVGLGTALAQGLLTRRVIPRFGERRTLVVSLGIGAAGMSLFGLTHHPLLLIAAILLTSLGSLAGPSLQALLSQSVPAEEQGLLQGGLTSLQSLVHIFAPLLMTNLFGAFAGEDATLHLPGMPFLVSGALMVVALVTARALFRRHPGAEADGQPVVAAGR